MKKILTSLLFACIFTLLIHFIVFLFSLLVGGLQFASFYFKDMFPIILSVFFIPSFLAPFSFDKKKEIKSLIIKMVKSSLLSFVMVYLLTYVVIRFYRNVPDIPFINSESFFKGFLSVFIVLFCFLVLFIKRKKSVENFQDKKITISYKIIFATYFLVSVLYVAVFWTFSKQDSAIFNRHNLLIVFYGLLVVLFLRYFFIYLRRKQMSTIKEYFFIAFLYVVNVILLPVLPVLIDKYVEKRMYPMAHLFDKAFGYLDFVWVIVIVSPYFLFLTIIIHFYYSYKSKGSKIVALRQKDEVTSVKYQQLKSQLSPHFLFNNISVLTGLIEENPKKAIVFSENLAAIYRYFLEKEKEDVVLLQEELGFVVMYISLLKDRFEDALSYEVISDEIENKYVIPLVMQQVIENVVKHNIVNNEKPIHIKVTIENDFISIENNINPKVFGVNSNKTGIKSIISRYAFFTNQKVNVVLTKSNYRIELPIIKIHK